MTDDLSIASFSAADGAAHIDGLGALLHACVETGAGVNFVLPYSLAESRGYWSDTVFPKLREGRSVLLAATIGACVVGSVRLDLVPMPNQPHRAEVSKLLVHPDVRRRGVARALMQELERAPAIHRKRSIPGSAT